VPAARRCIVVGAGLLGLSTAWALTRRGWHVVVLEAADGAGHPRSGSKGDARIFRLGYPDPVYVQMAIRARGLWRDLEAASGRRLLHGGGQVTAGDPVALEAIAAALAAADEPAERLSPAQAAALGITVEGPALFEPASGVLAAAHCLRALCESGSFAVRTGVAATGLRERPGGITVATGDGDALEVDVVVDCAGPCALALLGATPAAAAAPSLPQVAYFRPAPGAAAGAPPPVFIEWGDDMLYGLPVPGPAGHAGGHAGTYKVSHHTPGTVVEGFDPTDPAPYPDDPALVSVLADAVGRLLPSLDPVPVATERCVYDNSADTDFVLDRVGHVVVGCGTSGHGFKFGPLLGQLLADLAEGAEPAAGLGRFGLHRRAG
jgi:sarcosine oxidase